MITRSIKVFLGAPQMVAPPVSVSQMDTGWRFSFTAFDPSGTVWTPPEGASVTLEGKKLDNSYFSYAGTIEDGKALFDVTAQMVAIPGPVTCELRFYRNSESLGTANFEMMVEESPTSSLVLSQDEINVLNQLVADAIEDMDERKDAAAASAAAAAESETNAAGSAADALASETAAAASAVNAAACELDAAGSASSAASSAAAAAASESAAAESESQSEGYAASAESAASAASGSESAASASATAAGQSRAAAESAAAIAVSASTAAQTSANNAAASEVNARASEQSAEASKVSAASSASSASSSASSASGSASTATTAAQTATAKASEATTAASTATSASTAAVSAKTAAEAAQAAAEAVLESIPEDYSELSDDVSDLKSALLEYTTTPSAVVWEQGTRYPSSGGKQANVKRLRTNAFHLTTEFIITPKPGYMVEIFAWDASSVYLGIWNGTAFAKTSKYWHSDCVVSDLPRAYQYALVLAHEDDTGVTEMSVSEYVNVLFAYEEYVKKTEFDADKLNSAFDMAQAIQDGRLPYISFTNGSIGSSGQKVSSTTVIRSLTAVKFDQDTFIRCVNPEFNFALRTYTGADIIAANFESYLGTFEGTYRLRKNRYYAITVGKRVAETVEDVDAWAKMIEVWSPFYLETMRQYEMKRFAPFGNGRRKIIGHKGNTNSQPENTVPAFEAAATGNVWGIETDIQATSDGYLICMHDMTVDRTTTGTGTIANMTFAEIEALDIKDHPGLKVPTVGQYLSVCKTYDCVAVMELKNVASSQEMITKLIDTIVAYGMESRSMILCSIYSVGYVQCINPKIPLVFIIDPTDLETWISRMQSYFNVNCTIASGTYTITPEIVKQLHEAGVCVCAGGVNSVDAIKGYFAMGIDAVSSDFITTY